MQKINFEAFSCKHFHFKTVLQSAPEHTIFIQKIEKFFLGPTIPSFGSFALVPCPLPVQTLDMPLNVTQHEKVLRNLYTQQIRFK